MQTPLPPEKRPRRESTMIPNKFTDPAPDQPDIHLFNNQLNILQCFDVDFDYGNDEVKYLGSRKSTPHCMLCSETPQQLVVESIEEKEKKVVFVGETYQSTIGNSPSKRRRITPQLGDLHVNPWDDVSVRLPPLQIPIDPTLRPNFKEEKKSFEEALAEVRRRLSEEYPKPVCSNFVVDEVTNKGSGSSLYITKAPVDDKHVVADVNKKKLKQVYSFEDLFSSNTETQAEEGHLKHEELGSGVDIFEPMKCEEETMCEPETVEPMICDEEIKCEAYTVESMKRDEETNCEAETVESMKSDEETKCEADTVEPMICDEEIMCEPETIEPMKSNEEIKCEAYTVESMKRDEETNCEAETVESMKSDEETKCEADTVSLEKHNKRDVSLIERFTEEKIKLHIMSLEEGKNQGDIKETSDLLKEDSCQLCGYGLLMFPALPIYCSLCSRRIKDDSFYYIPEEKLLGDAQHQICKPCYGRCRTKFTLSGATISKAKMLLKNNADNQNIEEWVCCGTCGKWQHQICGLYNKQKDVEKNAEYICPCCLLEERKIIDSTGVHENTILEAKDLPETILSNYIEQRLFRRLGEERCQTAKASGKSINDVSKPEDLTLRVVFSGDKTSKVNKQIVDLLQKEHYPSEIPYRSKVILLFQKVEGADVCIFALFVQEFGSECSLPNQRSSYIFYLDSVKYFRPERLTFSGEALRTFVYHELLIGYLEYCKFQGFTTSYIWACPPPKGEDYIMYSHPKTQQIPNTKKLRQWYVALLDKAVEQKVVVNVTNLYDRFFVSAEESACNITAARLPYFEGSFWSYNAELLIQEIEKEGNNNLQKKAKLLSRRTLKGIMSNKSKESFDVDDAKNILLMQKLEKMILQNKEDFMVVELNYSCTRCSEAILSGLRWFCEKCKNLQLCERCHDDEQELPGEHIHYTKSKEKHRLSKVEVKAIQSTTEDNDHIIENNMFESRQGFLCFSQQHNYNFDTLRRAKFSSMMILHHLHTSREEHHRNSQNTSLLLQLSCCAVCRKDVSTTIYFPCLVCSDYRLCSGCYKTHKILRLLHIFPKVASANGKPARTVGAVGILNALGHAHECKAKASKPCLYPKCIEVKTLNDHSVVCKTKVRGACKLCLNLLKILRIHAHHCLDPNCPVPRCRDMKEHLARNSVELKRGGGGGGGGLYIAL